MSYKTVEVELENGRVTPHGSDTLPLKAHALLTLPPKEEISSLPPRKIGSGLHHFLSGPGFTVTPEQFHASMDADFFGQ